MDIKPGSMGKPLPGIEAAIVERARRRRRGRVIESPASRRAGAAPRLALDDAAYLHEEERYAKCFAGGWYLSGDLAMRDADGYFWFVGRADDLIKPRRPPDRPVRGRERADRARGGGRGRRVIGVPDETAGEVVKAYVALNPGFEPSDELEREILRGHARKKLGPAVAPREIDFRKTLPKTRSGKIMRRLLKARELGLPEGDISTLESDES
jgi:acetyl-CoA synthetase